MLSKLLIKLCGNATTSLHKFKLYNTLNKYTYIYSMWHVANYVTRCQLCDTLSTMWHVINYVTRCEALETRYKYIVTRC